MIGRAFLHLQTSRMGRGRKVRNGDKAPVAPREDDGPRDTRMADGLVPRFLFLLCVVVPVEMVLLWITVRVFALPTPAVIALGSVWLAGPIGWFCTVHRCRLP
jgi:hypothetical protein